MTISESQQPFPSPQRTAGALDKFKYTESSPALGREYHGMQLSSIIDNDAIIRDLAITGKHALIVRWTQDLRANLLNSI
jgi:hypothetical protein